jgi:VWFA-related protein
MTERKRTSVVLLAALALAASLGFGQEAAQEKRPPLRYDTSATLKLVTVRVLDREGKPVTGLAKEDFILLEDGQQKTITDFEVHALTPEGLASVPALPPAAEAEARREGETSRKLLFFLDLQSSDREGKAKAISTALHFLDTQVRPGDEVGVLGFYSLSGFFVRQYPTADMAKARQAVKGAGEIIPSADALVPSPDYSVAGRFAAGSGVVGGGGQDEPLVSAGTARSQRQDFFDRMKDLVEVCKIMPGNKSLIVFSARPMGMEAPVLGRMFGAAGTTVFVVNTQDWAVSSLGHKYKYVWEDHPLRDLAEASGGAYFADINDTEGVSRAIQDLTGHFYVLGYKVQESWDGKYHRIQVGVSKPEAEVFVQDGYTSPKPFAQRTDFEKDVQLLDLLWSDTPATDSLPLAVEPLVLEGGRTSTVCLMSRLEVGSKEGLDASKAEIVAVLRDDKGKTMVSHRWDVDLTRFDGRVIWPYLVSSLPAGTYDLRMVARDLGTGEACVGRAAFRAGEPGKSGLIVSSPLLFRRGREAIFTHLPLARDRSEKAKDKTLIEIYRLLPRNCHPISGEILPEDRLLEAVVPFEIRPSGRDEKPVLALEAKLIARRDGSETPLETAVRERREFEGGPGFLGAEITLPELSAGDYDLEISLVDALGGKRASIRSPLTVR